MKRAILPRICEQLSFRRSRNLLRSRELLNAVKPRPTTPKSATPLWNSLNIIHVKKNSVQLCVKLFTILNYTYIIVYKTSPFKINEYFIESIPPSKGVRGMFRPVHLPANPLIWTFPTLYISIKILIWLICLTILSRPLRHLRVPCDKPLKKTFNIKSLLSAC